MSDNIVKLHPDRITKDEVVALGVAAQQAKDFFDMLGVQNTQTEPAARLAQTERYERARADMWEAMNRHRTALALLGSER